MLQCIILSKMQDHLYKIYVTIYILHNILQWPKTLGVLIHTQPSEAVSKENKC